MFPFLNIESFGNSSGNTAGRNQGGFDFSQIGQLAGILNGSSGGSNIPGQSSGGAGSTIGGIAGAGLGSLLFPGIGTAAGGFLGSTIGGFFGGGGGVPNHEDPDEIKIATTNNITQQQASDICGYEESHSPRNYDNICKQAANDNNWFKQLWANYNRDHPSNPIQQQQASQGTNTQAAALEQLQAMYNKAKADEEEKAKATAEKAKAASTSTYALFGGGALLVAIIVILLLKK